MGVQGLWGELKHQKPSLVDCPRGAVLIDFHAWFFWLLDTLLPGTSRTAEQILSTDYSDVLRLLDCWLKTFEAQGLCPEFIVDGKAATGTPEEFETKILTWMGRRDRTYQSHEAMRDAMESVYDEQCPSLLSGVLIGQPFPKLGLAVRRHLKLKGYYLYSCRGEADKVIDIVCERFSERKSCHPLPELAFIVTNDTDLLLMPHTRVLFLLEAFSSPIWKFICDNALSLYNGETTSVALAPSPTVRLRDAGSTAKQLGISLLDLPGLALLRGNDYTANLTLLLGIRSCSSTLNIMKRLPLRRKQMMIDNECFDIRGARDLTGLKHWTAAQQKTYEFLCRFYRLAETGAEAAVADATASDYERARCAVYALRGVCDVSHLRAFTMTQAQTYARTHTSAFEYIAAMQRLDMPSFALSILSPNRTHFADLVYDDYSCLVGRVRDEKAAVELPRFTLALRQQLYALLLQQEADKLVLELWAGASVRLDTQPRLKRGTPLLRQLPFISDTQRLSHYLNWLCPKPDRAIAIPRGGLATCALAKLYLLSEELGDAALLSSCLRATHSHPAWRRELSYCCAERRDGEIVPADRDPEPTDAEFTLSEPGNYLLQQDFDLLKIPPSFTSSLAAELNFSGSLWTYLDSCWNKVYPHKNRPRTDKLVPSSFLLTSWTRALDYFDHLIYGASLFLLCENAVLRIEYLLDFHWFVLIYECLNDNGHLGLPRSFMCQEIDAHIMPSLLHICDAMKSSSWFKRIKAILLETQKDLP